MTEDELHFLHQASLEGTGWLRNLPPAHETYTPWVNEPTLSVFNGEHDGRRFRKTVMQWFGETEGDPPLPQEYQFKFDLSTPPVEIPFSGHPELYRISFLGPVRDWPNPEAVPTLTENLTHGDEEGLAMMIVSGAYPIDYQHQVYATIYALPFTVLLADPYYGVIRPKPFRNKAIEDEEHAKAHDILIEHSKRIFLNLYTPDSNREE